ncbi:MAG: P-loop NTPase [Aigarchaeota archaeon]|nr:P-loop NTPase [Aigarchaeota archaeon]MCX8192613.1 P-loop NTPase [Nitrososphaeria archaeon]MDW7985651.1 P-loop NTPase [Nitrososphaerota archaeon]
MIDPRLKLIDKKLEKVESIILFGSGKGGVGKSIISSAISYILSSRGESVAYIDLDFYGSAGSNLFTINSQIRGCRGGIELPVSDGVKVISTGYFLSDNPFPLMGKDKLDLLLDLFSAIDFGSLDFMIIDLPPGMGDEITFTQRMFKDKVSVALVTVSSEMSLTVVERLIKYISAERINLLGVIVNMVNLFRNYRLEELKDRLQTRILGMVSYHPEIELFRTIKEKLENTPSFKNELEEVVENILECFR